jgi:phosphoadenosine phosphosulfate reductase
VTYENKDNILIKFNEDVFRVTIHDCEGGIEFQLFSNNSKNEILFISALKNILRKAAYCIGCRVCEANCPNGYIKFHDGNVEIDDRCVHCLLCHKVSSSSCWVAESHRLPKEKMKMATSIDRYKTLGVQFAWVQDYLSKKDSFWNDNTLGTMMIAPLKAFLADANVSVKNHITDFGLLIASLGAESEIAWALMLCNAVYTSEFYWWIKNIEFNKKYSPAEILALLSEEMDSEKAQKNVVSAMKNICYSNPILGKELGLGNCECDQKGRATFLQSIIREPWSDPDPLVILYSLYKFAEACGGYYQFTLSTLMDSAIERDGISPTEIFGLSGETMEKLLNGLSINHEEFIKCSFKMDLDSITLREDKTSQDVLTLFA